MASVVSNRGLVPNRVLSARAGFVVLWYDRFPLRAGGAEAVMKTG
jgi:hypothetical protein